jgi:hypothetical protein
VLKRIAILVLLLIGSCASKPPPQVTALQQYISENKPLAENGTIRWSQLYEGAYDRAAAAGAPGDSLARINDMIRYAQQYEAGSISRMEFEYYRRATGAEEASAEQQRAEKEQARRAQGMAQAAAAMQMMQQNRAPPPANPSAPMVVPGILRSQSVSGFLRYCRYSNGVIFTVASTDLCPLNSE